MNCKCYGNNHNNQMIGATISGCGFFCKAGKLIKKGVKIASDLGLLPPGLGILINAGANALGAENADDTPAQPPTAPAQAPDYSARQLNQRISNNRTGRIPTVF